MRTAELIHAELRPMMRLATPVIVAQVGMMLMGVVDTLMVGRVSAAALASVALGNLYFFFVAVFGMGVLMSLDTLVSQAMGAGDSPAVSRSLQRGLVLAVVLGGITSVALWPGDLLLGLLRQPEEVVPAAASYARICIPGTFPFFAFLVLRQTLQALEKTRSIVIAIVMANLTNLGLNWVLIYGHLGAPALGVRGAAWATTVSRGGMAVVLAVLSWRDLRGYFLPVKRETLRLEPLWQMVRIGVPIGLQYQMEMGAFAIIALLMGWLGTTAMAAHQIALNLASLTYMVPLGVSAAAAVRVGQAVGRGDRVGARASAITALVLGAGFMALCGAAFLSMPTFFAWVYTRDLGAASLAAALIPIAGVFQVFDGIQVVSSGVLRGLGDTRTAMVVNLLGFWLVGMPLSLYLGFGSPGGPAGLWWGLVAGLAAVATFLAARARRLLARGVVRVMIEGGQSG